MQPADQIAADVLAEDVLQSVPRDRLAACNKVLILNGGAMRAFGPRDEVMRRFVRPVPRPVAAKRQRSG